MATAEVNGVRLAGIVTSIPERVVTVADDEKIFGEDIHKISASTGVKQKHCVPDGCCTSDLCFVAAEKLLENLGWERDSVQVLIFISQSADYILPATACSLQHRLQLSRECAAFDINLGCSGYPYGLWVASQLLKSLKSSGRALLLMGDTGSRSVCPQDRATAPLFGDAGSATGLELDENAAPITFTLGTDGSGVPHLIIPAGAHRQPRSAATARRTAREDGNLRSDEDLHMNGAEVFAFTLREVPNLVKTTLLNAGRTLDDLDGVVFHQANQFMMAHLAKRLKVPPEKFVLALENYGNTSSASVPLAISDRWGGQGGTHSLKLLLAGFGVGWSWAAACVDCTNLVLSPVITVPDAMFARMPVAAAA